MAKIELFVDTIYFVNKFEMKCWKLNVNFQFSQTFFIMQNRKIPMKCCLYAGTYFVEVK